MICALCGDTGRKLPPLPRRFCTCPVGRRAFERGAKAYIARQKEAEKEAKEADA